MVELLLVLPSAPAAGAEPLDEPELLLPGEVDDPWPLEDEPELLLEP